MNRGRTGKILILIAALIFAALVLTACELSEPASAGKYFINDNSANELNKDSTTKDDAIDRVTDSMTNLREYLDSEVISSTGYYMGMEFNIDTLDPETQLGGNFRLKIQAHLYTYPYLDEDGNMIYKYYDPKDGKYYDNQNEEGTREMVSAETIHNSVIKKSDILIEWYNGTTNEMLIGMYFDGLNSNSEDQGNVLYMNIQDNKRSFPEFGDTVLYRQLIRLLMSLSVEQLLVAGNIQGDAGTDSLKGLFDVAVTDNYKLVLNSPITSVLFYNIAADAVATNITEFVQGIFEPFEDKIDPLTLKYLGFKFSVVGRAVINSIASDMQFFTELDPSGSKEIMTGAFLTFEGAALSGGKIFNYVSDITFEYGAYPPEDMALDRDFYTLYEYGKYEFTGNLYIPMLNSNFDALIRTDMQRYDNSVNNVFMEYRDIANGELMIGAYYKNERTYIDISGMEYLYGWIDLNELGFPKVYDESLNLADALGSMFDFLNDGIVSIVDAILSPDKNDKENHLLEYIMEKTSKTEKDPDDIFSKNTVTLTVDMVLIKHVLEETGNGTFTTRQIIDRLDSMLPYSMDQIAIMLGVANAEIMLDNTYFTLTLNVDTNEITIKMFTNVGVELGEDSTLIFQLDIVPVIVGEHVDIAEINFDGFKPLEQIMTYSATMNGNFIFSTAETVDLSKLLSATIGENSGLNTPYRLPSNAGVTFRLIYDQFVTDHEVEGVLRKQGRSAFQLQVWLTGAESSVLLRLASDDVAFNNDVYQNQPARADELGYVWVSIECVKDDNKQRIPPVKIREDVFMSSMKAYMDGTSIADDAAELGKTEVNLSITSILFALIEDSYVVMEPEQMEITSSNETLQNIFRVKGLIGNIRTDAGFTHRVTGLQSIKDQYGMYQVGQFTDMTGNSPYDTVLHDDIPVYFYEDYHDTYSFLDYDLRVDPETGVIQVYEKGGMVSVYREAIDYSADSFFNDENKNNQDVSKVRFRLDVLPFIYKNGDFYYYSTYSGEEVRIADQYVKVESSVVYIYYLGVKDRLHHAGEEEYRYYDVSRALTDSEGSYILIYPNVTRDLLFEYDEQSIEITEAAKTQYAPRINGSFMGNIRRYILTITSPIVAERGKLIELASKEFYSDEDRDNTEEIYDENGILVREEPAPIVLYVMEPCEPLAEEIEVNIQVNNTIERYVLPAAFGIDWDSVTLKGLMQLTEVVIAPGTMGEKSYPVRVIVTNREIIALDTVNLYTEKTDYLSENVPVVDTVEIDPYDYILAKNAFFMDISNYNPDQYGTEAAPGQDPEYLRVYKEKEEEFVSKYFSSYVFEIRFNYTDSYLYRDEVKDEYIAVDYSNADGTVFDWSFDVFEDGLYTEDKITTVATGNNSSTPLYLHTYFKGQLVALQVNVGQRILSHIKFGEDDDFDPQEVNGTLRPGEEGYIYGHYVANYFDEESHTLPVNPILVFTDGAGHYFEKVFDMPYISGLASNGNYIIEDAFRLLWGHEKITYIGVNGSYYYENGQLINRPFDISNTVQDENGTIIEEGPPTKVYDGDITSSSINWIDLLAVYKPERYLGQYTGNYTKINLIAGDADGNGFMTTVLRITVECPKLDVAQATTPNGQPIVEADDADLNSQGNKVTFTPSAADLGGTTGYYMIDPLDADSLEIPTDIVLHFTNEDGSKTSKHRFANVQWRAVFDRNASGEYYGEGSMTNASGKEILRYEGGKYLFNMPTDEPMTTRIMAKIGSEVSGYQYITVCVRVLSKDPQAVEFYYGSMPGGTRITGVERTDLNFSADENGAAEFAFYTYYVNTFASFRMPSYIKAYFGVNKERSEYYAVEWKPAYGVSAAHFAPNSVQNLVAVIGTGDISIEIYLSVVVANHTVSDIELTGGLAGYYVQVGSHGNYRLIGELLQADFAGAKMGLYEVNDFVESYILVSMGEAGDNGVEAGKIGLYTRQGGEFVPASSLYPYDFIEAVYSAMNIYFHPGEAVEILDPADYYARFTSEEAGNTITRRLSEAAQFEYYYDAADGSDKANVTFRYEYNGYYYYLVTGEADEVTIYPTDGMDEARAQRFTLRELGILYSYSRLGENYDDKRIETVRASAGDIALSGREVTLKNIYTYVNGSVRFHSPEDGEALEFASIVFEDGIEASYEELVYRLTYYNAHRLSGYAVASIRNKATVIDNFEGLFYINDVVRSVSDDSFTEKSHYKIGLGTGAGAYDVVLRLIFDGGYRLQTDSESTSDIAVMPYSDLGYAQYGSQGFVLGGEISVAAGAVKQDGKGAADSFYYGPAYGVTAPVLERWYVERSSFAEISVGSFITVVPQSVIYSSSNGSITVSTLTAEGFRLRRTLVFNGVPEALTDFNSTNTSGLLIRSGTITIRDIYDYTPMTQYFSGTTYLPDTLTVALGGRNVTVGNVNWRIDPSWYGDTVISGGQVVGTGALDRMTYEGTYNSTAGTDDKKLMATAEILGWEEIINGQRVYRDRITVSLYISIRSAEIVALPWDTGTLNLDTTAVDEEGNTVYLVEADAFNDAQSSAVNRANFILPVNLITAYRSGINHTFRNVEYRFQNIPVASIPYNVRGIDVAALAETLGVTPAILSADHIDLTVNVGLNQVLRLRFRFYDKTVVDVTPIIEPDDADIRSEILNSMSAVGEEKNAELLSGMNQTRIRVNIENLIEQARRIRDVVVMPTSAAVFNNMTEAELRALLLSGWNDVYLSDGVEDMESVRRTDIYSGGSCRNYALVRLRASAESLADAYAAVIFRILNNDSISMAQKPGNIDRQISNYVAQLYNEAYDAIIGDYVKLELTRVLIDDMNKRTSSELGYASYYKNVLEGSFDYDYVIREFYRIREYIEHGMVEESGAETEALFKGVIADAVDAAVASAKSRVSSSAEASALVDGIFLIKLGLAEGGGSLYKALEQDVNYFVRNYAFRSKKEMRALLRELIGEALDFEVSLNGRDVVPDELKALIPLLVADNINIIQNFSVTISAIRRNLSTSADISSMVSTILTRGISNYVKGIYMESKIAAEIKKVQAINLSDGGYYYIDPYYEYRLVPTRLLAEFDEESGGFAHTFTAAWINDTVSGNVTYAGNAKNDLYGYVYAWHNAYAPDESNLLLTEFLSSAKEMTAGKSWAQIKSENPSVYNTLIILESLIYSFFDDVNDENAEAYILQLYEYYLAGIRLCETADDMLELNGVDAAAVRRDFDRFRYNELNANLYNSNTGENQTVSLVVQAKNRTLGAGDLIVLDDNGNAVPNQRVDILNPFESSVKDLPNRIRMADGEILEIVWNDVQVSPLGNLSARSHTIYGNIKNANGQTVTMELYVTRWEYAGVYAEVDGRTVMLNPLNFYFNNSLTYSAEESYEVRFNVYNLVLVNGVYVEQVVGYERKTFYPTDSELLVNTTDDEEMTAVKLRRNYVMYWDEMARANVLNGGLQNVEADLFLGNESIGQHNITSLSVGSGNENIPKKACYSFESMYVDKLAVTELDDAPLYGVSGEATYATDIGGSLPESGEILLNQNNIKYDMGKIEVRLLWNRTYAAAVSRLVNFIEYAYPEVERAAREAYAVNLIMNWQRSEAELNEIMTLAKSYVAFVNPVAELSDEELTREAEQLLMINERYDFAANPSALKGGSTGNQKVTVLVRYDSGVYVHETVMRVRLLFADYNPVRYYTYNPQGDRYDQLAYVTGMENAPQELYIGVRMNYWNEERHETAYAAEGAADPYDNLGVTSYRVLHKTYSAAEAGDITDGSLRLIKVTDIVYEDKATDGRLRSVSFKIDGVEYRSNLISLRVV